MYFCEKMLNMDNTPLKKKDINKIIDWFLNFPEQSNGYSTNMTNEEIYDFVFLFEEIQKNSTDYTPTVEEYEIIKKILHIKNVERIFNVKKHLSGVLFVQIPFCKYVVDIKQKKAKLLSEW